MLCHHYRYRKRFNRLKWIKWLEENLTNTQKRPSSMQAFVSSWNAGHPAKSQDSSLNQLMAKLLLTSRRSWETPSTSTSGRGIGIRNQGKNPSVESSVIMHVRQGSRKERGERQRRWIKCRCRYHHHPPIQQLLTHQREKKHSQGIRRILIPYHPPKLRLLQPYFSSPSRIRKISETRILKQDAHELWRH